MASACSVCLDQIESSVEWCPVCTKSLCSSCSQNHKQAKHHETIPYDDYLKLPPFIKDINLDCPEHERRYRHLCRKHDQLLCKKCLKSNHNKCKETPKLADIVKNVKTSMAFEDVIQQMVETSKILQKCITQCRTNSTKLQNQRTEMGNKVDDVIEKITIRLLKLKEDMLSELDGVITENENKVQETLYQLQNMEDQMSEILDQKERITQYASNFQTFIGIKEMELVVDDSKTILADLSDNKDLDQININLNQNKDIETLLTAVELFGEIVVTTSPHGIPIELSKVQQAQFKAPSKPPIKHQLQQTIELKHDRHCGGCTLPSGLMVVTGCNSHLLKIINTDGSLETTIEFENRPYDVTVIDKTHVAVSHPEAETISIVDIATEKVVKTLSTENKLFGITYNDSDIVFCVPEVGLKSLNIYTEAIHNVFNDKKVACNSYVVVGRNRICYTCPDSDEVIILNFQYEVIFTYQDQTLLRFPCGVAIGKNKHVYVTGFESNNILVISPDGKIHQLLSKEDGLDSPTAVHYNNHTKQLMAVICAKGVVHTYSLK